MLKRFSRRKIFPVLLPCAALALLFLLVFALIRSGGTDRKFQEAVHDFFVREISLSTINLHYTLADPASAGIHDYPVTYGSLVTDESGDPAQKQLEQILASFSEEELNEENQLIRRLLEDDLENRRSLSAFGLLQEILGPSLGIQAQLPILLCEYTFRTQQDILDYLGLLKELPSYFSQILTFEQQKSQAGCFMNDASVDAILEQCGDFLSCPPASSLLAENFRRKLTDFQGLTQEEKESCLALHENLLESCVYPGYRSLIRGLEALKGTGKNEGGLCHLPKGKDYYCWLIRTQVGTLDTPEAIWNRLLLQLQADAAEMQSLLSANPDLPSEVSGSGSSPEEILCRLQEEIAGDFPSLPEVDYEVKYVDESLADYLSPAFYLTPPADTGSPNSIYINPSAAMEGMELFTTLAHEGFPGHLYQTVYFASTKPALIRYLYEPAGYVEGWATYIESYAYSYGDLSPELSRLLWLNRSMNLCLYSLMDLGIHYKGWTIDDTESFLFPAGISDPETIREIYQYIVETPSNYLKYYYGYLNFLDLRESRRMQEGDSFNQKAYHREILELGPLPFYLLQEELEL